VDYVSEALWNAESGDGAVVVRYLSAVGEVHY